jgi:hypothetical protein
MAIRATIKFTSILVNQVYFTNMVGTAHWKNLVLDDIQLNAERSVFFYADSFSFLESQQFSVNKGIADGLTLGSLDPVFSVGAVRSDNLSIIDSTTASLGKNLTNTVSFNEVQTFVTGKVISDTLGFSDSVHTLLTYIRSFSHAVPMTDSLSLQSGKTATDSITLPDTVALSQNKGLSDSASISDAPAITTSKPLSHPIYLYGSLVATRQPYNFTFSDSGSAVTVTGAPTDTVSVADSAPAFNAETTIQDYFTLDDFAQVNKDTTGVKVNVVGLTDVISYDHVVSSALLNRALLGNMVLNAR